VAALWNGGLLRDDRFRLRRLFLTLQSRS
jgi:hypothetical protein